MTRIPRTFIAATLLALIFTIGIVGAAGGEETHADLTVLKAVSSTGPYEIDNEVTWVVTLRNNGPANATNISIAEDISSLAGLKNITAVAADGAYNTTTNIWTIDELENASYTTLTLTTTFTAAGNKTNKVTITALNETDPILQNNHAETTVQINASGNSTPQGPQADLSLLKVVNSTGPYTINDEVIWVVTLRNNGPANATNISIAEDISHLSGLKNVTAVAAGGAYNATTNIWTIDELENASYTTLTLTTTFTAAGNKTNKVTITALNETDPILQNNHAEATVRFNESGNITPHSIQPDTPISAKMVIKPTNLNLKSNGIFTVYISLEGAGLNPAADGRKKPRIDYANSSLICSGAEFVRATTSNKDGGTLIAKFSRADLKNVTSGDGVKINCSGTLAVNGTMIPVEGSDTIRVIGEKKGLDSVLSRLWKFLGIEKDDVQITEGEDGNITVTLSLNPDNFKNPGQAKKTVKSRDNESDTADNETAVSDQSRNGEEFRTKNNGNNNQIKEKNSDNKPDKEKGGSDKRDDESPGKSNGKKNK
jgi:uncharacterized repeat protein (TIGR01451 family)